MSLDSRPPRLTRHADGVSDERGRFFPFYTMGLDKATTTKTVNPNSRLYVDSLQFAIRTIAADTGTYANCILDGWHNQSVVLGMALVVPSVAQQIFTVWPSLGLISKRGASITLTCPDLTACYCYMQVADVDDT